MQHDASKLDFDHVSTLRSPCNAKSPESIDSAASLLITLERLFSQKNSEHLTRKEIKLIQMDCDSRIGELATVLITKFGCGVERNSYTWKLWCERCPKQQLERISLLCQSARK